MNMTVVPWYACMTYVRMTCAHTCARATHAIIIIINKSTIQSCNGIIAYVLRVARACVREHVNGTHVTSMCVPHDTVHDVV